MTDFGRTKAILEIPDLLQIQLESYDRFINKSFSTILKEFFPIKPFFGESYIELEKVEFSKPLRSQKYCVERRKSYTCNVQLTVKLTVINGGQKIREDVGIALIEDVPIMSERGSFIISGAEKICVSQIVPAGGPYFKSDVAHFQSTGKKGYYAEITGEESGRLILRISDNGIVEVALSRGSSEKILLTTFLRALDFDDQKILETFENHRLIQKTLEYERDDLKILTKDQACEKIFSVRQPNDPVSSELGERTLKLYFINSNYFRIGRSGRFRMNQKFGKRGTSELLQIDDIIDSTKYLLKLDEGQGEEDDRLHLGNRVIRRCGDLSSIVLKRGLIASISVIRKKMSPTALKEIPIEKLIDFRKTSRELRAFFATSELVQYMDQLNPLSSLTHARRLSVKGVEFGGLKAENARIEDRDVHPTHYGRICPIETPEGPNIGVVTTLSTYAQVNEDGFLITPYRKVENGVLTDTVDWLSAAEEDRFMIGQIHNLQIDKNDRITQELVLARKKGDYVNVTPKEIDYVDVSQKQLLSVSTCLIPFMNHNDANRLLMGTNMQRQAVPLVRAEIPWIQTGLERKVARDSRLCVLANISGEVEKVGDDKIVISGLEHSLIQGLKSNQKMRLSHRANVKVGDKVQKGDIVADSVSTRDGCLALGRNVKVAFMTWNGYNFEDSVLVSQRVVDEQLFESIHIERLECFVTKTRSIREEVTRDIPGVSPKVLRNLDERGVIRVGAEVEVGDVLVGKVTPRIVESNDPIEQLMISIFKERAMSFRNTSLEVQRGESGIVTDVQEYDVEPDDDLRRRGVVKVIQVYVTQKRNLQVGDKIAGRHGNKGIVSRILPEDQMPHLSDGTPVDFVLSPLGVPSRMNVGQLFETKLGWAAETLKRCFVVPAFEGADEEQIRELMREAKLPEDGREWLTNGKNGERFLQRVTVGNMYIMKLTHMVEDKEHARNVGGYSQVTQQPLSGKKNMGGQRLGEMGVWCFEAYGAHSNLREMLTVKSDDIRGRDKLLSQIYEGKSEFEMHTPETFNVLKEVLKGLSFDVSEIEERVIEREDV